MLNMFRFAVLFVFVIYGISVFVRGKLVIDAGDLDTLDAARIEAEATLVDKIVREGNCQGAKVKDIHCACMHIFIHSFFIHLLVLSFVPSILLSTLHSFHCLFSC